MVGYRGPHIRRVARNFNRIAGDHGQIALWREYVSASTGTASAYMAGGGTTRYYREQTVTGLFAAPQMGESRFREQQLPAGQVVAGDMVASLPHDIGKQDEIVWRGVTYRVEGDRTPIKFGQNEWYRVLLRRGDATG